MASSSKKPKEEDDKNKKKMKKKMEKKDKSNSTLAKEIKKPTKKPEKKASPTKKANKSKPKTKSKPDDSKNKSSNGTLVESEIIAAHDPSSSSESEAQENENKTNKNVKPNKRKRKEKVEENGEEEEEGEAKMCRFPMNRIKRIIKSEDSRMAISQDVVFLVNKATEKFLEKFCEDGYKCSVKDRKKSLSYKHLSTAVHEWKRYDFLSDYVPEKIKAGDALKERNLSEAGEG